VDEGRGEQDAGAYVLAVEDEFPLPSGFAADVADKG
jgi:hypothetical protein